ncbi:O-antigen ligase family protein [Fulvivirgaceae bacterium PWU5]|uniref:O-antigen ligase family protein n=1 Tax=Dawidia cretensis TaxID=2782350 RepID=A0AAP2E393_9BACT|nr:O-antigen ligase family protein [Dawidia cretensis]MBT1712201.1 O-antigen ligase family protein [Dawidia cretensis]
MNLALPDQVHRFAQRMLPYSIYAFMVLYPFSVKWANFSILAICALGLLSNSLSDKLQKAKTNKGIWLYPVYSGVLLLGALYSADTRYAFKILETGIPFLLLPVLFATAATLDAKTLRTIGILLVAITCSVAVYCVVQNVLDIRTEKVPLWYFFTWEYSYSHLAGHIGLHPTYFAALTLLAFFTVLLKGDFTTVQNKVLNTFILIFLSIFLILLGAKIGLLIFFAVAVVLAFIYKLHSKRQLLIRVGIIVLLLVAAYNTPVIYWRFKTAVDGVLHAASGQVGADYRTLHWRCAAGVIQESPWVGHGIGDVQEKMNACYDGLGRLAELRNYNAHNQYLDSWAKTGILGLVITLLCLACPLYTSFKAGDQLFAIFFFVFLVVCLTECFLNVQKGVTLFCFTASIYWGHLYNRPGKLTA